MKKTTVGVFPNRLKIEMVINELRAGGITDSEISCIYTDREGVMHDSQSDEKMEHGAATGAATGAVIGALAGLVVANGIIPGLGTLFVAGPLVEVLGISITGAVATAAAGAATGAVVIGVGAALMELGVDNDDAVIYEESVKSGEVVLMTRTSIDSAKAVMLKNKATKVREYVN